MHSRIRFRGRLALAGMSLSLVSFAACANDEPSAEAVSPVLGACDYTSPFTQGLECREYIGTAWSADNVASACDQLSGSLELGGRCSTEALLGRCSIDTDSAAGIVIFAYGAAVSDCAGQQMGCEVFGGGTWEAEPLCENVTTTGEPNGVFIQPTLECRDPLPGEPVGQSDDGRVCTWQAIAGCTEEGRRFSDYASCEVVRTQRPYYSAPPATGSDAEDARMDDADYTSELAWVKSQIEASACICCHADDVPGGSANWNIDAPGNWMNTFRDSGLALGASYVSSVAFGAYPPEDNNGFERETSGFPSTDPVRMRAFFVAELEHRGLTAADFADTPPFGGPINDQLDYTPGACSSGEGVGADGRVVWEGGPARYVYVLAANSANPTVPPNLDLPDGTHWRVDVPASGTPLDSGEVFYGELPDGATQRFPETGAPAALVPGSTYYLYVTQDVGIPLTRCQFTH